MSKHSKELNEEKINYALDLIRSASVDKNSTQIAEIVLRVLDFGNINPQDVLDFIEQGGAS